MAEAPAPVRAPARVPALARIRTTQIKISKSNSRVEQEPAAEGAAVVWPDGGQPVQGHRLADEEQEGADGPPGTFSITANKNRNVTVRIKKKSAYKRLKNRGSIKTTITVVTRGSDGKLRRKSQKVTMVLKGAKKAKQKQ